MLQEGRDLSATAPAWISAGALVIPVPRAVVTPQSEEVIVFTPVIIELQSSRFTPALTMANEQPL
jgi:hypothetical protein